MICFSTHIDVRECKTFKVNNVQLLKVNKRSDFFDSMFLIVPLRVCHLLAENCNLYTHPHDKFEGNKKKLERYNRKFNCFNFESTENTS